jgi:hypothetical protein
VDTQDESNADALDTQIEPTDQPDTQDTAESSKDTQPDKIEVSRYKDLQGAYTRSQQELKELRSSLDQLRGEVVATNRNTKLAADEQPTRSWIDDEKIADEVRNDPASVVKLIKTLREEFAQILQMRDAHYEEKMTNFDPAIVSVRETINELKKDPDYKGFNDRQLSVIAKKMKSSESDGDSAAARRAPPKGAPGGGRSTGQRSQPADFTKDPLWKKIYGEE